MCRKSAPADPRGGIGGGSFGQVLAPLVARCQAILSLGLRPGVGSDCGADVVLRWTKQQSSHKNTRFSALGMPGLRRKSAINQPLHGSLHEVWPASKSLCIFVTKVPTNIQRRKLKYQLFNKIEIYSHVNRLNAGRVNTANSLLPERLLASMLATASNFLALTFYC